MFVVPRVNIKMPLVHFQNFTNSYRVYLQLLRSVPIICIIARWGSQIEIAIANHHGEMANINNKLVNS